MGKGLVLYKSKYGATKKYAQMTAEEFGADLLEIDKWKGDLCQRNFRAQDTQKISQQDEGHTSGCILCGRLALR